MWSYADMTNNVVGLSESSLQGSYVFLNTVRGFLIFQFKKVIISNIWRYIFTVNYASIVLCIMNELESSLMVEKAHATELPI